MRRFFAERVEDGFAHFSGSELAHMKKVLRLKAGDRIIVPEGRGEWICELEERGDGFVGRLIERRGCDAEPKKNITLYLAYTKSDKLELCVQKAVELGASAICPFISSRCVKIPDEKSALKANARMAKIAHEAVKQCGRSSEAEVDMPIKLAELPARISKEDACIFAYEKSEVPLKGVLEKASEWENIGIIIGPEGGFTDEEAELIEKAGAKSVSLGTRILRAETAAIALLAIVSHETEN